MWEVSKKSLSLGPKSRLLDKNSGVGSSAEGREASRAVVLKLPNAATL